MLPPPYGAKIDKFIYEKHSRSTMDIELLKEVGLTEGEIKVYLALFKIGASSTGPIVKEAKIHSSKVYPILDRLIEKGLVSFIKEVE